MDYVMVRYNVEDWKTWKPVFDKNGAIRREWGSKHADIYRNSENDNEIVLLFEWDHDKARKFLESPVLKKLMKKAGVVGKPDFYLLEGADTQAS